MPAAARSASRPPRAGRRAACWSSATGSPQAELGAAEVEIVHGDAEAYLRRAHERPGARPQTERFDVVFLDPPFRQNVVPPLLGRLEPVLGRQARVYIESESPVTAAGWQELKRDKAGLVSYQLLRWSGDDQGGLPRNV
jgi:16S rRNA (guanine966-N2)-methyltransferase